MGDPSPLGGPDRNLVWMHFSSASDCHLHGPDSAGVLDASLVGDLRRSAGRYPDDPQLRQLVARLSEASPQFRELWSRHEIEEYGPSIKRVVHSEVDVLDLDCDILSTQHHGLRIMMFSAEPGSESDSKLALLGAIGIQDMAASR